MLPAITPAPHETMKIIMVRPHEHKKAIENEKEPARHLPELVPMASNIVCNPRSDVLPYFIEHPASAPPSHRLHWLKYRLVCKSF
jgi:hypothetical protein